MTPEQDKVFDAFFRQIRLVAIVTLFFVVLSILGAIGQADKSNKALSDLSRQIEVLKGENRWSQEDRADLHETQGQLREALKRLEVRKK